MIGHMSVCGVFFLIFLINIIITNLVYCLSSSPFFFLFLSMVLVESIPEGLVYPENSTSNPSVFQTWLDLLNEAKCSVDIASFYWTMTNNDTGTHDPSADQVKICS